MGTKQMQALIYMMPIIMVDYDGIIIVFTLKFFIVSTGGGGKSQAR